MSRHFLSLIALFFVSSLLPAQIHLVGSHYNGGLGTVSVFRWDATTGLATDTVLTPSAGIVISSSVFDAYNDAYYYADGTGMNRIDLDSNSFTALGGTLLGNSTEIDMATGNLFRISFVDVYDTNGMFLVRNTNIVSTDLSNGMDSTLGTIPQCQGIYADASCFNSNLSIYYFIGVDSALGTCLYSVNTTASLFTFSKVPLVTPNMVIHTIEYDNEFNILYAMTNLTSTNNFQVQQVDPMSGALTLEADFPQLRTYQVSTCSFDQTTSSMVFVLGDSVGNFELYLWATPTNVLSVGQLPFPVMLEMECDNSAFARLKYGSATAVAAPNPDLGFRVYPNPANDIIRLMAAGTVTEVNVVDALGKSLPLTVSTADNTIDVSQLPAGCYYLRAQLDNGHWTLAKFIKQ